MTEFERMAELLLPDIDKEPGFYEDLYPARNLPEGARVTRVAPSPTGYLHLGTQKVPVAFSTQELKIPTKSAKLRAVSPIL